LGHAVRFPAGAKFVAQAGLGGKWVRAGKLLFCLT
jgi:hypothetical protein